jgi:hypothetical protein
MQQVHLLHILRECLRAGCPGRGENSADGIREAEQPRESCALAASRNMQFTLMLMQGISSSIVLWQNWGRLFMRSFHSLRSITLIARHFLPPRIYADVLGLQFAQLQSTRENSYVPAGHFGGSYTSSLLL